MAQFGSLWVGDPLTKIQIIALSSFAHYGHDVYLYVYDDTLEVPVGITKRDARDIMPEDRLFKVSNSYAPFADMFRYQMIEKTGLAWVDADVICLTDSWDFKDNIYCSKELESNQATNSVLAMQPGSEALHYLIKESTEFDKSKIKWSEIGPQLVHKTFVKFGLQEYMYPYNIFCGIGYTQWRTLWEPMYLSQVLSSTESSSSISVYNFMCTLNRIDKNSLKPGSAMEYFYNKYYKGMTI